MNPTPPFTDPVELNILLIIFSVILTFTVVRIWDMIVGNRKVKLLVCADNRARCQKEMKETFSKQDDCFEEGDSRFVKNEELLALILIFLHRICGHINLDCEDLTKDMVQKGILK